MQKNKSAENQKNINNVNKQLLFIYSFISSYNITDHFNIWLKKINTMIKSTMKKLYNNVIKKS